MDAKSQPFSLLGSNWRYCVVFDPAAAAKRPPDGQSNSRKTNWRQTEIVIERGTKQGQLTSPGTGAVPTVGHHVTLKDFYNKRETYRAVGSISSWPITSGPNPEPRSPRSWRLDSPQHSEQGRFGANNNERDPVGNGIMRTGPQMIKSMDNDRVEDISSSVETTTFSCSPDQFIIDEQSTVSSDNSEGVDCNESLFSNPDDITRRKYPEIAATIYIDGLLKPSISTRAFFSRKIFLGGLPREITEKGIVSVFKKIGPVALEWPGVFVECVKKQAGFAYVIFDNPEKVETLLGKMCEKKRNQTWLIRISGEFETYRHVQVIPWDIRHNSYVKPNSRRQASKYIVFVGGLHGKFTASSLAKIMDGLFGGVMYTSLDTDKYGYPVGVGQVGFNNRDSYIRALTANFVKVRSNDLCRVIQVEPYLTTNRKCEMCLVQQGPYFCKDFSCLKYFCMDCFRTYHINNKMVSESHLPKFKAKTLIQQELGQALLSCWTLECQDPFDDENENSTLKLALSMYKQQISDS